MSGLQVLAGKEDEAMVDSLEGVSESARLSGALTV